MYTSRICPMCKMNRFPAERTVKEGKHSYVIYKCPVCSHQDIERLLSAPAPRLWSAKWGFKDELPDVDASEGERS